MATDKTKKLQLFGRLKSDSESIVCTVSGDAVAVTDASDQPLRGLRVFGKSTLDGEPSPENPVPIVSAGDDGEIVCGVFGKNLLEYEKGVVETNGITFVANNDGSITANGTATVDAYFRFNIRLKLFAGDYFFCGSPPNSGANTYALQLYKCIDNSNQHQKLVSAIPNEGITFTLSKHDSQYDIEGMIVIRSGQSVDNLIFRPYLTLEKLYDGGFYKPVTAQTSPISTPNGLRGIPVASGGNYTDADGQQWICDEIDFGRGVYIQRVNKIILDGTEKWQRSSQTAMLQAYTRVPTAISLSDGASAGLSTHYKVKRSYTTANKPYLRINSNTQLTIEYELAEMETLDAWKTYLAAQYAAGTPVSVMYGLDVPVETPLTEAELIAYRTLHSNKPNTTVYTNDMADVEVSYVTDTKLHIEQNYVSKAQYNALDERIAALETAAITE